MALAERVRRACGADGVTLETRLQSLWGGYGELWRAELRRGTERMPVVVKVVQPPAGEQSRSHRRKLTSYDVERCFYARYAARCNEQGGCRVPKPVVTVNEVGGWLFVLEDLDASGFAERRPQARPDDIAAGLRWLAAFHARFLHAAPDGLWKIGTYWHLGTRPDELAAMRNDALRRAAARIDALLNRARFKTFVHGDAKLENICFSASGEAALVDFQYVGGGAGVKDVAYFLSSCLSPRQCEAEVPRYLGFYFGELRAALSATAATIDVDASAVEREWRELFPLAWTDFYRFLLGWAPGSYDRDPYSEHVLHEVLASAHWRTE